MVIYVFSGGPKVGEEPGLTLNITIYKPKSFFFLVEEAKELNGRKCFI